MTGKVAVVTDSTSYLPTQWAIDYHIEKVPVQVIVDGQAYREGIDISTAQVAEALAAWRPVSTSRPSPTDFLATYEKVAEQGAQHIVSAHLSADLSGTYETARLAAAQSPIPVTVIDSRTMTMALGYACISGAEVAAAGGSVEDVASSIVGRASRSRCYFYVDTLEYLKRGGRMGKTAAALGTALRVKPLLAVEDGRVEMLEKARTMSKAINRLAELGLEAVRGADVDIAVQHIGAARRADELARHLSDELGGKDVTLIEIGAVVGAHVGPGTLSVVVAPRSWSDS